MSFSFAKRIAPSDSALHIAAQSVLASRVRASTVQEVESSSALDHLWSALFRYALLRVGEQRAAELLSRLAEDAPQIPSVLDTRPCPELYRALRRACLADANATTRQLRFAAPRGWFWTPADPAYAGRLAALREALSGERAEAVELHLVHGLTLTDVAHVMEQTEQAMLEHMRGASQAVHGACRRMQRLPSEDGSAAAVLREAFSLDPARAPAAPRRMRVPVLHRGAVVAERYAIRALLGAGAFADVYEARDLGVEGHVVALKMARAACLDERSAQLALRELQLLASVFHPSVVQLNDHGWHDRHLWFVMPLYRGETLAARLRRAPLSRAEAQELFVPLAGAVATMHRVGVLHQDIKPDNIFLAEIDPTDRTVSETHTMPATSARILPVLLDLGVAARTAEVVLAGTPAYLAPEAAARFAGLPDPAPVGPKADVFALALTLRDALEPELCTRPPLTSVDAFVAHRASHPPAVPVQRGLRDLRGPFKRWLALSPDDRPSADALCSELALLTAPARRSARRAAALRWLVPTTIAVLSVFSSVVFWLSREAALQRAGAENARLAAELAQQHAAALQTDVRVEQARSQQLAADVSRLRTDYDRSQLSRTELSRRLEQVEGGLHDASERNASQQRRFTSLALTAEAVRQERDELQAVLRRSRVQLGAGRKEAAEQLEHRARLEKRIADLELALEAERVRAAAWSAAARVEGGGHGASAGHQAIQQVEQRTRTEPGGHVVRHHAEASR